MNPETRNCQNCKNEFRIAPEDFEFYEKMEVPPPTWCPECRLIRRFSFRNERNLYANTCALCGQNIISVFHHDLGFTVYCQPCWWSDKWNPLDYEQDYDFSKPFFAQFRELMRKTPWAALMSDYVTNVNSDYVNMASHSKNCYLTSHADHNEDSAYASGLKLSKDCYDGTMVQQSELSYECLNVTKGFKNVFSVDCENSYDIYFSRNLVGCSNCVGCVNLRNKSHHIFNEPYTKEEYFKKLEELNLGSYESLMRVREKTEKLWNKFPQKYYHGAYNTKVSGDYIHHSKDVHASYEMIGVENAKFCQFLSTKPTEDCYDYTEWGDSASLIYEAIVSGVEISKLKFVWGVRSGSRESEYTMHSTGIKNVFGCVNLRKKEYCILNRQYTKESFDKLKAKIIGHMYEMPYVDAKGRIYKYGEFFPSELSPFAYNETVQEFFPLTKEEAIKQGFRWRDPEARQYQASVAASSLPDNIKDAPDSILGEVIGCAHEEKCNHQCTKAFRLISPELAFLRKMNLPLPRLCPNCRHYERIKYRNPMRLWKGSCQCAGADSENLVYKNSGGHPNHDPAEHCHNGFETSYAPDRPEIVYCESCYLAEVM
ncbi:MAG: hypothetical protein AAB846_01410 [Patescibacteria group bacterium]